MTYACHFNVICCISVCNKSMLINSFFIKSFDLPFQSDIFHVLTFYLFVLVEGKMVCLRDTWWGKHPLGGLRLLTTYSCHNSHWPPSGCLFDCINYPTRILIISYLFIESVGNLYCSYCCVPMNMWQDFCISLMSSFLVKTTHNNIYMPIGCNDFIWYSHTNSTTAAVVTCISIIYALKWIWNISCIVLCCT